MIFGVDDVGKIGTAIAAAARPGDAIGLIGDLGAGKTTLARAILAAIGLVGEAPSPSFAIVQPYAPPETAIPVLHIDLYRIDDPADIAELGLEEQRCDHLLLVEWPERMGPEQWRDMLLLTIETERETARRLTAHVPASWGSRWPFPT